MLMTFIRVDYSPVHELVTSLFAYTDNKNQMHDLGNKWRKEIQKNLPVSFTDKLEELDLCDIIAYLHLVIADSPEKDNIERFLAWFADLGEGHLYEILAPYLEDGFPMGLKTFRELSHEIMSEWHRVYPITSDIHDLLRRSAARMEQLNKELPYIDLIDEATSGIVLDPEDEYDAILLIPTYHIKPLNRMDYVSNRQLIISYAVDDEQLDEDTPTHQLLRMTKGLADEKGLCCCTFWLTAPSRLRNYSRRPDFPRVTCTTTFPCLKPRAFCACTSKCRMNDINTARDRNPSLS